MGALGRGRQGRQGGLWEGAWRSRPPGPGPRGGGRGNGTGRGEPSPRGAGMQGLGERGARRPGCSTRAGDEKREQPNRNRAAARGRILPQEPVHLAGVRAWLSRRRRRLLLLVHEFVLVKLIDVHPAEARGQRVPGHGASSAPAQPAPLRARPRSARLSTGSGSASSSGSGAGSCRPAPPPPPPRAVSAARPLPVDAGTGSAGRNP